MRRRFGGLVCLLAIACAASTARAEVIYGDHVSGLLKYFQINNGVSNVFSVGSLAFDPTTPNQLYVANYVSHNTYRGIYTVDLYGEEIDISDFGQTANVRILWELRARNDAAGIGNLDPDTDKANDADFPASVLVDASGNLRVAYDRSESIWRVDNPLAAPPAQVESQMFGAYGNPAASDVDDDIISIAFVPPNFGGGFTAGSDIITFDQGHDGNFNFRIGVVSNNSTAEAPIYQEIFSETNLGEGVDNIDLRGDASVFDGKAYFARYNHTQGRSMFVDDIGNGDQPYIERVDGTGNHEYIFLDLPDGFTALSFEDALKVNPADGSVWFAINNEGSREFYRVDVANATHVINSDYIAPTTLEIAFTPDDDSDPGNDSYNIGMNSMAFSPDGKLLVVGDPDGRDRLFVYDLSSPSVQGDFNGDGNVDGADFVIWQTNFPNNTGGATLGMGDANGDGNVDGADFVVWQTNFPFNSGAVAANPVPEPSAIWLASLASLAAVVVRRRGLKRS